MKWLVLPCLLVLFFSCKKDVSSFSNTSITPTSISFPKRLQSPFGVMVADIPDNDRIITAKLLGINYIRAEINLNGFTQALPYIDSLENNGFEVIANFDYNGSVARKGLPYISNPSVIANNVGSVLKQFHPYLVAIENEEAVINNYSGSIQGYINELAAATQILHTTNIKVTNGGLTEDPLCILVYRDYLNRGLTAQAADFAKRTMPPAIISDLPNLSNYPQLANRVQVADTLLKAYKSMNFDYINFHWYEPVIARWPFAPYDASNMQHVDTRAMSEVMTYLNNATGKTVISNEVGELYDSPGIVQDMMQQFATSQTPFVIWYSGDGHNSTGSNSVALNNPDGTLRDNGKAFLNFLQSNYSNSSGQ